MSDRVVDLLEFETGTPDREGQIIGHRLESRVGFSWARMWPYVFMGASLLTAGFYWYAERPRNAKKIFGLFGTPKKQPRRKRRK
jgi:hypothetical protein